MGKDLKLNLKIDPQTDEMVKAIKALGADIDRTYEEAKKSSEPWALAQTKAIEGAVKGLEKQRSELAAINALMDPTLLEQQVALELQIENSLRRRKEMVEEARKKHGPTQLGEEDLVHELAEKDLVIKLADRDLVQKLTEKDLVGPGIASRAFGAAGTVVKGGASLAGGAAGALGLVAGAGGINRFADAVGRLQGSLGPVGLATDYFAGALAKVPGVGPAAAGAVKGVLGLLEGIVNILPSSSPAVFQQLQVVLTDTVAVVGNTFTPVFETLIPVIQLLGDAIATVLPSGEEMRDVMDALKPGIQELSQAFKEVVSELGPLIRGVYIDYLKDLAGVFVIVAKGAADLSRTLLGLLASFGIGAGAQAGMRSQAGAAARPAHISGVDQYQQQLQTAAFSIPGRVDPVANISNNVGIITRTLQDILTAVNNVWGSITSFVSPAINALSEVMTGVWEEVTSVWDEISGAVSPLLNDVWEAITDLAPLFNGLGSIITTVGNLYVSYFRDIATILGRIWAFIQPALNALRPSNVARNTVRPVVNAARDIIRAPEVLDFIDPLRLRRNWGQ